MTQIDTADVLAGALVEIDTLVLPGGLVADYETSLGKDLVSGLTHEGKEGRKTICDYIYNGGGYYGVCAGAFYAGSCNYEQADEDKRLVGAEIGFHPGLGEAKV